MPLYVVFATLLNNENQAVMDTPQVYTAFSNILGSMGAKILNQYGPMSSYDIVDVVEVPDGTTASQIEHELSSYDVRIKPRLIGPYPSIKVENNRS